MQESALSDIKVLDFSHHIAGPYCTKLLADYGADVIKVERPGSGDRSRSLGPFPDDIPHQEKSGLFLHLNTNKRSVTLDLKTDAGVAIALKLAERVDIVVESFKPGAMERFGLGYDALRSVKPDLVLTSVSNFGQTGPYRDWKASEAVLYGMGGDMYSTGVAEKEPIKLGGFVGMYQAGAVAAYATMAALFGARLQGVGEHVDISIFETQLGSIDRRTSNLVGHVYTGEVALRTSMGTSGTTSQAYPCADGYLEATVARGYVQRVIGMLRPLGYFQESKWDNPDTYGHPELQIEAEEQFLDWCLRRTKMEAWQTTQAHKVLTAPLNSIGDASQDPTLNERGAFQDVDHPQAGALKYAARPFILPESPWSVRTPPPLLGQHTAEVLSGLGYNADDIVTLRRQGVV